MPGKDAGAVLPGTKWSLLLHTMESDNLDGAVRYLIQQGSCSHFAFDWRTERLVQMVSMNRAARSLASGGNYGKTNAARVIQVEMTGHATDAPDWPKERNEAIGRMIARIAAHVPFRVDMPLSFYGDRSGFTVASKTARQRLSWPAWYRFDAICGHQHAPNNSHWDPGAIDTAEILAAARGTKPPAPSKPAPAPDPEEFTVADIAAIVDSIQAQRPALIRHPKTRQAYLLDGMKLTPIPRGGKGTRMVESLIVSGQAQVPPAGLGNLGDRIPVVDAGWLDDLIAAQG